MPAIAAGDSDLDLGRGKPFAETPLEGLLPGAFILFATAYSRLDQRFQGLYPHATISVTPLTDGRVP